MNNILRPIPCLALLLAPLAASAAETEGKRYAVLIGVEKYHRAAPLRFTVNDVRQLSVTLTQRGSWSRDRILEMTDSANDRRKPLRTNLLTELPKWLSQAKAEDSVLVYFSGHGFRDTEGTMYLAPLDCDPENPEPTGIAVSWLREQLAACAAGFKLLVLDSCHAGSEKSAKPLENEVRASALAQPFEDLEGVVTIASCTADQRSQIWDDKQQSLFSYWLVQALKGHADRDGDGGVDIDELYKYVSRTVEHAAEARFPLRQTPVRIVRSGTLGVPVVTRLKPHSLKSLLADMAEQIALALEERRLGEVGVLEFINYTEQGPALRAKYGLLGSYCADELEKQLRDLGAGQYSVVDRRRLQRALSEQGFSVADLASPEELHQLSRRLNGLPVLAVGALQSRAGRQLTMQCKLMQCSSGELAAVVGGTAQLTESEWAMLGRSVVVRPEDRRPVIPVAGRPVKPLEDRMIEQMDRRADGGHPLQEGSLPYRLRVLVNGKEVVGRFHGNDYVVGLNPGDVYELEIVKRDDRELVLLRLLVDGLNTKPEPVVTKGVQTTAWAQRVNLDDAQPWKLIRGRGLRKSDGSEVFALRGFYSHIEGPQSQYYEFKVVDGADSLAAQQQFTSQIGIITAAFYAPAGGSRGAIGTGAGKLRTEDVRRYGDVSVGNLLGVIHVRYVDAREFGNP